jgi:FtsP/CotA-like multicopper oxidase with cupredoxin domain
METPPQADLQLPLLEDPSLTRRRFLRGAALAGGGLIAAGVAACAPAVGAPGWTFGPGVPSAAPSAAGSPAASAAASAGPSADPGMSMAPSAAPSAAASAATGTIPPGWTEHDVAARDVVRRYLGDLVPALKGIYGEAAYLKMVDILGPEVDYPALHQKPAFVQVPQLYLNDALKPLTPTLDGDVKVFKLTIDELQQQIDELLPPVAGLGFNAQWPGPTIRVNQGDKVRAEFTNNLNETTGIHFHGVEFDDFFMDGVPFVT